MSRDANHKAARIRREQEGLWLIKVNRSELEKMRIECHSIHYGVKFVHEGKTLLVWYPSTQKTGDGGYLEPKDLMQVLINKAKGNK